MATTPKGIWYPGPNEPNDISAHLQSVAEYNDANPGIASLTTTERNALTGAQLWHGRTIFNLTAGNLETYSTATSSWSQTGQYLLDQVLQARDEQLDLSGISTTDGVVEGLVRNTAGAGPKTRNAVDELIASAEVFSNMVPRRRMDTPPTTDQAKYTGIGSVGAQNPGSGFVVGDELTIAGGTFLVPAVLRVSSVSGGQITGLTVLTQGLYTAAPSSPVSIASSTGASTNATINGTFSTATASGLRSRQQVGPTDARFRYTGTGPKSNIGGSGYYGSPVTNGVHSCFEWATDAVISEIRLIGVNSQLVLFVDGQQVQPSAFTTDASGGGYLLRLDFKGTKRLRNYKLIGPNMGFGGVQIESDSTLIAPTSPTRKLAWILGDSYAFGNGAENIATQAVMVMADALGIDVIPNGVGGSGWLSSGSNLPVTRINQHLAVQARVPDIVIFDLGYNDAGGNMTTLTTNLNDAVDAVQAALPAAQLLAFGPATPLGETANLLAVKNAVSAAMAAQNVPFVDVADWVNAANKSLFTDVDNVHPKPLGHKYIGARKALAARRLLTL